MLFLDHFVSEFVLDLGSPILFLAAVDPSTAADGTTAPKIINRIFP